MVWQYDQVRWHAEWYYNYTGQPWTKFGSVTPDFREGHYFDIGIDSGVGNYPLGFALFYQFGVASKTPFPGWSVKLLYPSFLDCAGSFSDCGDSWKMMERANLVQGPLSYWKGSYRWGGLPYNGVLAQAQDNDKSIPLGILQLTYSGAGTAPDGMALWPAPTQHATING